MKKDSNNKNYGNIVIPKARGARKSLFRVGSPNEGEDIIICLRYVGQAVCHHFSPCFLCL